MQPSPAPALTPSVSRPLPALVLRLFGSGAAAAAPDVRPSPTFAAIDFETANPQRDSACSVAIVRVEGGRVVGRLASLIRPVPKGLHRDPRELFTDIQTSIHGIRWADVQSAPSFAQVWQRARPLVEGVRFFAAHNAPFDRSVLNASCAGAGIVPPMLPFLCTVKAAKACWGLRSARLPLVAHHLGLHLDHHDAASDAEVCAQVASAIWRVRPQLVEEAVGQAACALAEVNAGGSAPPARTRWSR